MEKWNGKNVWKLGLSFFDRIRNWLVALRRVASASFFGSLSLTRDIRVYSDRLKKQTLHSCLCPQSSSVLPSSHNGLDIRHVLDG